MPKACQRAKGSIFAYRCREVRETVLHPGWAQHGVEAVVPAGDSPKGVEGA